MTIVYVSAVFAPVALVAAVVFVRHEIRVYRRFVRAGYDKLE